MLSFWDLEFSKMNFFYFSIIKWWCYSAYHYKFAAFWVNLAYCKNSIQTLAEAKLVEVGKKEWFVCIDRKKGKNTSRVMMNWGFCAKVSTKFLHPPAEAPAIHSPVKDATSHLTGTSSSKASGLKLQISIWSQYLVKSLKLIQNSPAILNQID